MLILFPFLFTPLNFQFLGFDHRLLESCSSPRVYPFSNLIQYPLLQHSEIKRKHK